jgi:uncharacterized protein (TIGR02145 family)
MKNFKTIAKIGLVAITTFSLATTTSCTKDNFPILVPPDPTSVTDIDGNVYPIAKICGKFWMTENLRTTRYNDGTVIPTGLSNTAWGAATTGACAFYNDLPENNTTYGKLYNWFAANNTTLAPTGWHVATEAEWVALIDCLGGSSVAGGKMKSTSSLWAAPNTGANNSSGFNGLPGGFKSYSSGSYTSLGNVAYFWASNERNATQGEYILLDDDFASTATNGANKTFGYSIRCIKN